MMVFDTLFALDAAGDAQPQMLAGLHRRRTTAKPGSSRCATGLLFHDGTKVLARDVVASLHRWGARDAFGQALMDATDELSAPTDKVVRFRLNDPSRCCRRLWASPPARWPWSCRSGWRTRRRAA